MQFMHEDAVWGNGMTARVRQIIWDMTSKIRPKLLISSISRPHEVRIRQGENMGSQKPCVIKDSASTFSSKEWTDPIMISSKHSQTSSSDIKLAAPKVPFRMVYPVTTPLHRLRKITVRKASVVAAQRSKTIDAALVDDKKRLSQSPKVLLMEGPVGCIPLFLHKLQTLYPQLPQGLRCHIYEDRLHVKGAEVTLITLGKSCNERRKWIHQLESVPTVIFIVDLSAYNEDETPEMTFLTHNIECFEAVVNTRWFMKSQFLLLLGGMDSFAEKLKTHPLRRYFPDYTGGEKADDASAYILAQYTKASRQDTRIDPYFLGDWKDEGDANVLDEVFNVITGKYKTSTGDEMTSENSSLETLDFEK